MDGEPSPAALPLGWEAEHLSVVGRFDRPESRPMAAQHVSSLGQPGLKHIFHSALAHAGPDGVSGDGQCVICLRPLGS
jgi:hypothetical protein